MRIKNKPDVSLECAILRSILGRPSWDSIEENRVVLRWDNPRQRSYFAVQHQAHISWEANEHGMVGRLAWDWSSIYSHPLSPAGWDKGTFDEIKHRAEIFKKDRNGE